MQRSKVESTPRVDVDPLGLESLPRIHGIILCRKVHWSLVESTPRVDVNPLRLEPLHRIHGIILRREVHWSLVEFTPHADVDPLHLEPLHRIHGIILRREMHRSLVVRGVLKERDKFVFVRLPTQKGVLYSIQIEKKPLQFLCSQYHVDSGRNCAFKNF